MHEGTQISRGLEETENRAGLEQTCLQWVSDQSFFFQHRDSFQGVYSDPTLFAMEVS